MDRARVSFEDALRPAMVHFVAVPEMHQDLLAEVIAVMGTDALKTVVLIGVSIQSALKTAVKVIAAGVTGVLKDGALKSVGMAISASKGVVLMTDVFQTVVLELVASAMARSAAFAQAGVSAETVSLKISPAEKRLLTGLIQWLMICFGDGMPLKRHWRLVVRSIASGAQVRCAVLPNSCSFFGMPKPLEFL